MLLTGVARGETDKPAFHALTSTILTRLLVLDTVAAESVHETILCV